VLVDDDTGMLKYLSDVLETGGFEVFATDHGADAVPLAKKVRPDLIVLDIFVPDLSGSHIAEILAEDKTTAEIPILFATGIVTKQEEATASLRRAGHYLIAKPIRPAELLETVNRILAERGPAAAGA